MVEITDSNDGVLVCDRAADMITLAIQLAEADGCLPQIGEMPAVVIERPQKRDHGDYSSNIALRMAKAMEMSPMAIAQAIAERVEGRGLMRPASAAPPGFVNLTLDPTWLTNQIDHIRSMGDSFGAVNVGKDRSVQVEFVSVNPTGPLHVGHARGAVIGSGLASILSAAGYKVQREYYVNDAGNQMDLFARSIYSRYMQRLGNDIPLPEDGYRGDYVTALAETLEAEYGAALENLPDAEAVSQLRTLGVSQMLSTIRIDLEAVGVEMDVWFKESSLFEDGTYDLIKGMLGERGLLVNRDGALWFASTSLGEEKDNVIERSSGEPTYFASDIAYHYDKFARRNFDSVVDVWGADHQGHVPRMKAVVAALGINPDRLEFMITQMVKLKRGDETVKVSKRSGELITLREFVNEVGVSACRFFFLSRSAESQMDFDMELAKRESAENPVYYVQYAHARIASILRLANEREVKFEDGDTALLTHEAELSLMRKILELPELIALMAARLEPHHLPHYAVELATSFHGFYQQCRVISSEPGDTKITKARLKLLDASRVALARCMWLMGISAPERM